VAFLPFSASPKRLIASIHDVSPRFEGAVDLLVERLHLRLGGAHFALLVVPDYWGEAPLTAAPGFRTKLRRWADSGLEVLLHGWNHRDDSRHAGRIAAFKARRMTAGEGEFLGLDRIEAMRRLERGRTVLEDALGRPVHSFVAPAWLYGEGARQVLADLGFRIAEDHMTVWNPATGARLCRGPVITWASRSRLRAASSIAFAAAARTLLQQQPVVRIGLHPGDAGSPLLLDSIDRTLRAFRADRSPSLYADLLREAA
jgi:predicted deacetylase